MDDAASAHISAVSDLKTKTSLLIETQGIPVNSTSPSEHVRDIADSTIAIVQRANERRKTQPSIPIPDTAIKGGKRGSAEEDIFMGKTVVDKSEIYALQKQKLKAISLALDYRKRMIESQKELENYKKSIRDEVDAAMKKTLREILSKGVLRLNMERSKNDSLTAGLLDIKSNSKDVAVAFSELKRTSEDQIEMARHSIAEGKNGVLIAFLGDLEERTNYAEHLKEQLEEERASVGRLEMEKICFEEEKQRLKEAFALQLVELERDAVARTKDEVQVEELKKFQRALETTGISLKKHATYPKKKWSFKNFKLTSTFLSWDDSKKFSLSPPTVVNRVAQNGDDKCFELGNPERRMLLECDSSFGADTYCKFFQKIVENIACM